MLQQPLHLIQELDGYGAGQRSAAERGAVQAGVHAAGDAVGGENCAQRQSGGEWFGDGDDVRLEAVVLVGKPASGAAQAALDFVENQQRATALGQLARGLQKFRADRIDAALALNRFQTNGADAAIELALQIVDVVEANETDAGQQRRKGMAILRLSGGGQRSKGAAVEGIFESDNAPLGFVSVGIVDPREGTGQFQRAFPGLGAAIAEENFFQAGNLDELLRQIGLELVEKQVRDVNQLSRLALQYRFDRGMSVAERVDAQAAEEVEILLALRVPQIDALAAGEQDILAVVGRQQHFGFGTNDGSQVHAPSTSVPHSILVK